MSVLVRRQDSDSGALLNKQHDETRTKLTHKRFNINALVDEHVQEVLDSKVPALRRAMASNAEKDKLFGDFLGACKIRRCYQAAQCMELGKELSARQQEALDELLAGQKQWETIQTEVKEMNKQGKMIPVEAKPRVGSRPQNHGDILQRVVRDKNLPVEHRILFEGLISGSK